MARTEKMEPATLPLMIDRIESSPPLVFTRQVLQSSFRATLFQDFKKSAGFNKYGI